ncbi:DNA/RNA nuclease SfsA [Halogeometricum sp. S1BR25-6]|uniref:DNA/RNA nuclease SfsA n=1 Tax=Halogeometricum salsisoli TaxID=2950536 RepID=A0ABU2GLY5_9EURY|nr:DNA/RNA nuclease SfsA [Halogeometricum sp. S1BR25-6]MDS0301073.1 DNA/RNA nuclease SfsA [Halogeometricum sp. S1BR25-6]
MFVVKRPDVERFLPHRAVDSEFAELLARVRDTGVGVYAATTSFERR